MARSDLLVALVKAGASGDKNLLRTSTEALIADERSKQHHIFAERLGKALASNGNGTNGSHTSTALMASPSSTAVNDLFVTLTPQRRIEDLILPSSVRGVCESFIEEQRRADLLRSHALEPRHRVLMSGPPGNG